MCESNYIQPHIFTTFLLKRFPEKIINLRIIKELADIGKIRFGFPKTRDLRICLKSETFF
jgi:hypothetical protein